MDLTGILRDHADWLIALRECLQGGAALDERAAVDDQACRLGQWLKKQEGGCAAFAEYRAVCVAHAAIHQRAAECLRLQQAGRGDEALADMGEDGELRQLSIAVIRLLLQLKKAVAKVEDRADWAEALPSASIPPSTEPPSGV